ncbi:MAG: thioredoxin family protein [Balneolaceae bacterium]|nr:thioredoxin family protein [Balneolaceae bacterium]
MTTKQASVITREIIEESMSYSEYRKLIDELLEEGKTTSGDDSDEILHYTRMNIQRMNRLDKRTELNDTLLRKISALDSQWIWLVLTEGWCGDAAQNVPVLNKIAETSANIDIRFILRDKHLDIMDEYLTNGGRSIPKLICLDANTLEEIGTWGPRPAVIQEKAMEWKDDDSITKEEWAEKLHKWYAEDSTQELQDEFTELIELWRQKSTN